MGGLPLGRQLTLAALMMMVFDVPPMPGPETRRPSRFRPVRDRSNRQPIHDGQHVVLAADGSRANGFSRGAIGRRLDGRVLVISTTAPEARDERRRAALRFALQLCRLRLSDARPPRRAQFSADVRKNCPIAAAAVPPGPAEHRGDSRDSNSGMRPDVRCRARSGPSHSPSFPLAEGRGVPDPGWRRQTGRRCCAAETPGWCPGSNWPRRSPPRVRVEVRAEPRRTGGVKPGPVKRTIGTLGIRPILSRRGAGAEGQNHAQGQSRDQD